LLRFVFQRWRRQLHASAEDLRCCGCNPSAASQILGLGCANLVAVSPMATSNNLSSMTVKAWCIHLDPIPRGKVIFVSGPEPVHVRGPSLFLDPGEIIHHSRPTLRYRVLINILEVEDSDSSSDDVMRTVAAARSPRSHQKCFLRPWPKHGDGNNDDGGVGAAGGSAALPTSS
jgi:hypothetical protein